MCAYILCIYIIFTYLGSVEKDKRGSENRAGFHPINHKMLQSLNIHSGMRHNTKQEEERTTVARQSSNSDTFPVLHHKMRSIQ